MKSWKKDMKKEFGDNYSQHGSLPLITISPLLNTERKILIIGSEFGDVGFCADAIFNFARTFTSDYRPLFTKLTMAPVIDTEGHPNKCKIISSEGFENPSYLSNGKPSKDIPSDVSDLLSLVRNERYDLVVQATAIPRENWPYCDGYFAVPKASIEVAENGQSVLRIKPETKDIAGTVINAAKKHAALQSLHAEGIVGDRYIMLKEGLLIPAHITDTSVSLEIRNIVSLVCIEKGLEYLTLVAASSKKANNDKSRDAHKAALESLVKLYEKSL